MFNIINIPDADGGFYTRSGVCTGWIDRLTKGIQKKNQTLEDGVADLKLSEFPKVELPQMHKVSFVVHVLFNNTRNH